MNEWMPGFKSQTCDPTSRFFVGSIGGSLNRGHAPSAASVEAITKIGGGVKTKVAKVKRVKG